MSQRLVTVFGATGNQGGSVARLLLQNDVLKAKYRVRAVTRDPSKAEAANLRSLGAEIVQADLNDVASIESAIAGSYAVFGVTNYWETMSKTKEVQQGKNIVLASKSAHVRHLIWSSLPDAEAVSGGSLTLIDHFASKAEVERFAESQKNSSLAVSYFMPGYFMSNFVQAINPGPDGTLAWAGPMDAEKTSVPMIDIQEDTGKFVAGLIEAGPEKADGVRIQGVSQWASPKEVAAALSEAIGKPVSFAPVPVDVYKTFLPPAIAEELAQNIDLIGRFDYFGTGSRALQAQSDAFLLPSASTRVSLHDFAKRDSNLLAK